MKSSQVKSVTSYYLHATNFYFKRVHDFYKIDKMQIIIERIHCFSNCNIGKQRRRSDNRARKDVFKQRVKETNIVKKTASQKKSFTGNESVVKTRNKEKHYTESFVCSRCILYSNTLFLIILNQTFILRNEGKKSIAVHALFIKVSRFS